MPYRNKIPLSFLFILATFASYTLADQPLIVAHRGLLRHAPENTISNFRACLELRLGFEFDVRRTNDGQLVCVHDDTVDRTTNGKGKVSDLSFAKIKELDAGSWFDPKFAGEKVPAIEEIMKLIAEYQQHDFLVAVDLKATGVEQDVVRIAVQHKILHRLLFIGRTISEPTVRGNILKASVNAQVAVVANNAGEFEKAVADIKANWVYVRFLPSNGQIALAHKSGKKVFIAGTTVAGNLSDNWQHATSVGVDAILTDYPFELRDVLRKSAKSKVAVPIENPNPLGTGYHTRTLKMGERERTYLVYVPKGYDPKSPTPVVLALHGAAMNGPMMVWFSGLTKKADEAGFIVVYPSGTGIGPLLTWNAGGFRGSKSEGGPDDVAFISELLDDLGVVAKVDEKRVFACGMSNGGMMCYRLAAELSDRIAAIAPVAGTITIEESKPKRPVPVIHFHGTKDNLVRFEKAKDNSSRFMRMKSVEDSIQTWVKLNGCGEQPKIETISKDDDEMKVTRKTYGGGKDGAEVILVVIENGGHTWPGQQPPVGFIGKSAKNVSANDLMWEFFEKHPMK